MSSRADCVDAINSSILEITDGLSDCPVPVLERIDPLLAQAAILVGNAVRASLLAVKQAAEAEPLEESASPRSATEDLPTAGGETPRKRPRSDSSGRSDGAAAAAAAATSTAQKAGHRRVSQFSSEHGGRESHQDARL